MNVLTMKTHQAFSLLEVLITLSIIAMMAFISLPSLRHFFIHIQDKNLQLQLLRTMQLAHQESRARGVPVVLCGSTDHVNCVSDWTDGQIVFVSEDENGVVQDKEQLLAVIQSHSQQGTLFFRSYPYYRNYLLFLPSGLVRNDNGTFWYCHGTDISPAWAMMLSKSGRTHVVYPDRSGMIKDSHGKSLGCDKN
jgi:type IV fimbrial biogenesis protein FimT